MDIGTAINRIAERTAENRQLWGQSLRQRRTEFTDVYGVPYYSEIDSTKNFMCHVAVPLDLEYYMRFQFKLIVKTDYAIDPNGFKFFMTDASTYDDDEQDYDWIELSEYLEEQTGIWPTGDGYYPEEGSDDEGDYYDILDACCILDAEGKQDEREMLLRPGSKIIKIHSPVAAEMILQLFFKASNFGC